MRAWCCSCYEDEENNRYGENRENPSDVHSWHARPEALITVGARLQIQGLTATLGKFRLSPVTLDVIAGEYLVLLGPSGCGKTTFIELLCGLRKPAGGHVYIGGRDVTHTDPADRHAGYVPQDYLLFPSRTTAWNLRFAARFNKRSKENTEDRFESIVKMLHLDPFLRQPVQTLSGGEKQRVALGRALMAVPDVLLLDEPVSALPESMRDRVCRELKALQQELGVTAIHVCHNLDEALSVADRLALMDIGRLVQTGRAEELLDRPANRFVAEFTHCKNLWPVEVGKGKVHLGKVEIASTVLQDGSYWAVVRPNHLSLESHGLPGRVVESSRTPHAVLTRVDIGPVDAWIVDGCVRDIGEEVCVAIPEERVHLVKE